MNGAGNKVGIETDPVSSLEQDCLNCSTVISSKVSADPRQTHRTYCVFRFHSSLFPCESAWQVDNSPSVCLEGSDSPKNKMICFVNEPKADNMRSC